MEEATPLESLQRRLADVDRKVQAYRHDMETDFLRYYHHLLHDVSPAVASQVRQSLAKSLLDYPALSLNLDLDLDLADSRTLARPASGQRHNSPPTAVSPPGSGVTEPPRSPRDREQELQGLFTPSYLPLLDSSPRLPASPPVATAVAPTGPSKPTVALLLPDPAVEAERQRADMDRQGGQPALQDALPVMAELPARPGHIRQSTDDTISSVLSDRSDLKTPRSALRRTSSASKPSQSPRRVRFDFMGAEVLPTASPQATDFMAPPTSPSPASEPASSASMLYDDFEEHMPPRKISSSEALRALSRAPLDTGTVWTVVNSNPDDIVVEQEEIVSSPLNNQSDEPSSLFPAAPDPPTSSRPPEPLRSSRKLGMVSEEPEGVENDDSSDEEFLSMAKSKPSPKKAPLSLSPTNEFDETTPGAFASSSKSDSNSQTQSKDADNGAFENFDEEDEMFHFEAGGLSAPPRPRPKPISVKEEEVEQDVEDVPDTKASLYATSPAVHIAKHSSLSAPTTPTMAKFQAGSLGSYKGRPVIMPVVRNPDIHAQAASLGQFNTFVGGLDGRSGMDEGDLNSFRASVATMAFSGTPRSFTERLMIEDAMMKNKGDAELSQ
ncbi:hypothetical protein QQZ08_008131 [Neonectria magnoliae]|uniref:Uncharacterized protein n=1 Tax=Neonectria magnoliae TaxID=2732573 RepID=A0ABR1HWV1_9HYPO